MRYIVRMGAARHDGLAIPGRVILAHEPPFRIGDLSVRPAMRQIQRGEQCDTIEPRVMQVLVALARAGGEIVTRDELIEWCWDGRVVGDDSINRVLSRIRRLAVDTGGGGFTVETIPRVGYRLIHAAAGEARSESWPAAKVRTFDRRYVIGGAGGALAIASAAGWRTVVGSREEVPPEAKALFERAVIIRQEDNRQALAHLREAVRIAPEYGEAWGALALSYRFALENEAPERVAGFEERLGEAVRNAQRYDPGNGDAAAALLPSGSNFGRWSERERVFQSAIRRNPNHAAGYSLLGTLLMDVGRWSDAVTNLRAAKSRASSSPLVRYKLIVALWAAGQITAAEDEIDQAMQLWPQHGAIWQTKIKLLALTGRPRHALALAEDPAAAPLDERDAPDKQGRLLYLTALATRSTADADRAIESAVRKAREIEPERLNVALQAATLGRTDLALDLIEGIYLNSGEWALRSDRTTWIATHPLFQPHAMSLWREQRFNRILQTIGLERYWRTTGTVPDYRRR